MADCKYYVNGVCTNDACGDFAELCPLPSVGAAFGDGVCCYEDVEPTMAEKEYIERGALMRKECPMRHANGNCLPCGGFCTAVIDPICEAMHNAYYMGKKPTADVVEVRHGEWIKDASTSDVCAEYRCSLCGVMYCESDPKYPPYKYCPECGAKNE